MTHRRTLLLTLLLCVTTANGFSDPNGKDVSACFWYQPEPSATYSLIHGKQTPTGFKASFQIDLNSSSSIDLGMARGDVWETVTYRAAMIDGRWYHVGVVYQDSDRSYNIRIWDDTAGSILDAELIDSATKDMEAEDAPVTAGATTGGPDCRNDRLHAVMFSGDVLSAAEIDRVRKLRSPVEQSSVDRRRGMKLLPAVLLAVLFVLLARRDGRAGRTPMTGGRRGTDHGGQS